MVDYQRMNFLVDVFEMLNIFITELNLMEGTLWGKLKLPAAVNNCLKNSILHVARFQDFAEVYFSKVSRQNT